MTPVLTTASAELIAEIDAATPAATAQETPTAASSAPWSLVPSPWSLISDSRFADNIPPLAHNESSQ
jgi:hypothetical protein